MNKIFFLLSLLFFLTNACKKIERINPRDGIAGVTTSEAKQFDLSTLQISSSLNTIEGVAYVTQRGICWSTSPNPTTNDNFTNEGSGFGTFESKISGLSSNTTYYFRAFASNDLTTAYGNEVSFKINADPSVLTKQATSISYTSVNIGCKLVSNGGYTIEEQGIFWDVFPGISEKNQKIKADKTDFDYSLSGLENGKTHYYRSYVLTNYGYVFGQELSFVTLGYNTPSLSTKPATSIGEFTANSGGKISSDGGLTITAKGVCWSTSSDPTISDSKTIDGTDTSEFVSKLTSLNGGTKYYIRAYATNSKGISYGNLLSFTTYAYYKPNITTNPISNITKVSATSGGTIVSDGGLAITAKGVCWSTSSNPTLSNSKTSDGTGIGNFTSQLTGLQDGTTYFVRTYATNSKGTSYGNEVSFTTVANTQPILATNAITSITGTSATSGGTITTDGGLSITAKGVCWSTTSNPTIADSKTSDGIGSGNFTSQLSGLQDGATYYIRAYATNTKGTSYGNEISFISIDEIPVLTTNIVTNIGRDIATCGGTITRIGSLPILAKGVCWSLSANPTIADNKTNDGVGSSNFTSQLTALLTNSNYYVKSYVTTSKGTYYGDEINFKTLISSLGQMISDVDGNTYKTVYIGSQLWMAENLKVSKYSDGTTIPNISDQTQWKNNTIGAWVYYNNDANNNANYGKLYNWYAVSNSTNGNKNLCPTGWHVPSDIEWSVLTDYLGGASVAGGKMKEVGTTNWYSPNTDATNTSLFSALPGGFRMTSGGYYSIGSLGYCWSSSGFSSLNAWCLQLTNDDGIAFRTSNNKENGGSVRCLRD